MDRGVERILGHFFIDKVEKTVFGLVCGAVEIERQTFLEV